MIKTISTAQQSMTLRQITARQKTELDGASRELATGLKRDVFESAGNMPSRALELRAQMSANEAYMSANTGLAARLEVTVLSLDEVRGATGEFKNLLISGDIASMNRKTLQDTARNVMQSLVGTLNGTYNGEHLFSGTQTDRQPLAIGGGNVVTYAGGTQDLSTRIDDDLVLSHGIRADHPAFASIFEALSLVLSTDLDAMTGGEFNAFQRQTAEALSSAETDIVAMQARLGDNQARLERTLNRQSEMARIYSSSILGIEGVEPEEAALRVEALSTQLQSTFAVTARMSQLSFLNFMK